MASQSFGWCRSLQNLNDSWRSVPLLGEKHSILQNKKSASLPDKIYCRSHILIGALDSRCYYIICSTSKPSRRSNKGLAYCNISPTAYQSLTISFALMAKLVRRVTSTSIIPDTKKLMTRSTVQIRFRASVFFFFFPFFCFFLQTGEFSFALFLFRVFDCVGGVVCMIL